MATPFHVLHPTTALPEPDAAALAHGTRVKQYIGERIAHEGGWISFARFMDLALYTPGLGYYAAGLRKFGSGGDFVTAPETTPLFGRTIARQVAQILQSCGGDILELGAGSGALAVDVMTELGHMGCIPSRYCILEPSAELAKRQRQRITPSLSETASRVEWISSLPQRFTGVVVANEVLDALPVHILVWRDHGLYERGVRWVSGNFEWAEQPASASLRTLAGRTGVSEHRNDSSPYVSEVCPAATSLVADLGQSLDRGMVLLLDYGYPRSEYYHPARSNGTLMCHYRHHAHDDPFLYPGLQDITAHVDFTAVAEAAVDAGFDLAGYTDQAWFLVNSGITELLARTSPEDARAYLPQAAAVQKLLSPLVMGDMFKVMALTRGIDEDLIGFREGERSGTL